jgi:DNA-binding transcriptional LysR family regulator
MTPTRRTADPAVADPIRSLNWSSLKDFLAVAECGSLSAAARRLGVSQPTLTRRMSALEESLHAELFLRSPQGLELTEAGEAMLEPARQMEQGAQAVELAVTGRDLTPAGLVRITATDGLAVEWLTPALAEFRARHPRIDFEIITGLTAMDLLRREVDIAIRLGRPQQSELLARRVGDLALGLYGSRAYLEEHGTPESEADLAQHRGISFDEGDVFAGPGVFLDRMLGEARIVYRANSLAAQLAAIRAGFGLGGQACFIANRDPNLVRVLPEITAGFEIWLVTHPGLRRSARIRAVYDFLVERLTASRALLANDAA